PVVLDQVCTHCNRDNYNYNLAIPKPRGAQHMCPFQISEETITPLNNTKHLLVSAYMDQRVTGFDIRIIGIFRRDSIQPLHCLFCCSGYFSGSTPATISQHSDNFGFAFVTTDIMCQIPQHCNATHVTLLTQPDGENMSNQIWLQIRNKKTSEKEDKRLHFNFTVCISNLFGDYNNVLQFAQTLEIYRLLGVDRVVIYKTSCGPELDRLLQIYTQEGFVEMVPWPIDQHLNPSRGWLFSEHGGDVHYFGQLTTLNECIYRSMDRSHYVLLNDIDEIIMPYQHNDLMSLMNMLQQQHPDLFLIENHIFPKNPFDKSANSTMPQWRGVPGFNILEHIYREEPDRTLYHPHKMIVKPRAVEQTSVHDVLKMFGQKFKVPLDICRIIHSPISMPRQPLLDQLHLDTRLWDFKDRMLPNVMTVMRKAGLLKSEEQR
uniref:Glycosyltransferase family 92 protein n=1 Tax=Monopterus albus TaxID=43700 RepID=A0A3Q3RB92_MONAL